MKLYLLSCVLSVSSGFYLSKRFVKSLPLTVSVTYPAIGADLLVSYMLSNLFRSFQTVIHVGDLHNHFFFLTKAIFLCIISGFLCGQQSTISILKWRINIQSIAVFVRIFACWWHYIAVIICLFWMFPFNLKGKLIMKILAECTSGFVSYSPQKKR